MYVHMVEEKELSVVRCGNTSSKCIERTKGEVRIDEGQVYVFYFIFIMHVICDSGL